MKFNNRKEKMAFEKEWKIKRDFYLEQGMSEKAINVLYHFDLDFFNSTRRFMEHNLYMDEVPESELADKTNEADRCASRYWWVNEITHPKIEKLLMKLSEKELEILYLYYYKKFTQAEIGKRLGESQKAVSKCIEKFRKIASELEEKEK